MIVCVPVAGDGVVGPWGRAPRVAVAEIADGELVSWQVHDVGWDAAHDAGTEGSHHARIARFVKDAGAEVVVAHHMGPPMERMLDKLGIEVHLGAAGDAKAAVQAVVAP